MSSTLADLKRVASTSGLYAAATVLQRGMSFLLLPVYTRFLVQAEYGILELLNGLSAILFGLLLLGMPSALTKVFHRDCETESERRQVMPTALVLDLPVLLAGAALLFVFAEQVGWWLIGEAGMATVVRLTAGAVVVSSLVAIVLANFRAREQAVAFAVVNFAQFSLGMLLNIALVVWFKQGIYGVLWGNLAAAIFALPVGLAIARRDIEWRVDPRLVRPLLHFGVLVIPTAITGWVITMADRYMLRYYDSLETVAIYSVGYKIGMIMQMGVVWPFQLAWPAVAFSISKRVGHERTYARVLTYLSFVLALGVLALSLGARVGLDEFAGPSYRSAHVVVPLVALAYAFAGVQYCLSPGIHIEGMTKYLPMFSLVATVINLGMNFLLVPSYGMLGATWATVAAYFFLAVATSVLSHRVHPVRWEYSRLLRIVVIGSVVYAIGVVTDLGDSLVASLSFQLFLAFGAFPVLLLASGFLQIGERTMIADMLRRYRPWGPQGDGSMDVSPRMDLSQTESTTDALADARLASAALADPVEQAVIQATVQESDESIEEVQDAADRERDHDR